MSLRVFADPALDWTPGAVLPLTAPESHYLVRVRRAKAGSRIEVLDGECRIYSATVVTDDPRAARIELAAPVEVPRTLDVQLAVGLPQGPAGLETLRCACEAGANTITLILCERAQGSSPAAARVGKVMRAAQRQCGRPAPPGLRGPTPLADWLNGHEVSPGWFASVRDRGRHTALAPTPPRARLLVGPEGGLTEAEQDLAADGGLDPLSLGPWTLRTQTAVVAGLTRLLTSANMAAPT